MRLRYSSYNDKKKEKEKEKGEDKEKDNGGGLKLKSEAAKTLVGCFSLVETLCEVLLFF